MENTDLIYTKDQIVHLNVPFQEKDTVKALGAFWNGSQKCWCVRQENNLIPFLKWLPVDIMAEIRDLMEQSGSMLSNEEQSTSLAALLSNVGTVISSNLGGTYWVKAEVLHIQSTNGNTYLELVDSDSKESIKPKTRGILWAHNAQLLTEFKKATGIVVKEGMNLLLNVSISFHTSFGLSLNILSIDHNFSIGEMEKKVTEIRNCLIKEGVYDLNKKLHPLNDYTHVAVIAPSGAAGLGDFMTLSNGLQDGGLCEFDYYNATFSGSTMEDSLLGALSKVNPDIHDAVIIIRGGGDKAGLYELNNLNIARRICNCPVPVICGVGHERDSTILDEVSHTTKPTPSMVAADIAGKITTNLKTAKMNLALIHKGIEDIGKYAGERSQSVLNSVTHLAGEVSTRSYLNMKSVYVNLLNNAEKASIKATDNSKGMMERVVIQNPTRILEQGYAVVRGENDKMIKTSFIDDNQPIKIQLNDGIILAKVSN